MGNQEGAEGAGEAPAGLASDAVDCHARYLAASRAFLGERSMAAMKALLAAYALHHVAERGSEAGLDYEIERIETQCRNILAGLP